MLFFSRGTERQLCCMQMLLSGAFVGQCLRRVSVCDWCVCRRMDSRGLKGHSSGGRVCVKTGMHLPLSPLTASLTANADDIFPSLTPRSTISLCLILNISQAWLRSASEPMGKNRIRACLQFHCHISACFICSWLNKYIPCCIIDEQFFYPFLVLFSPKSKLETCFFFFWFSLWFNTTVVQYDHNHHHPHHCHCLPENEPLQTLLQCFSSLAMM